MMTPDQAVTSLVALVGGTGVSGIIVAFIGYLTAARNGHAKQDMAPTISIGGNATGKWDEATCIAIQSLATHTCRIAAILEIEADERWEGKGDFGRRLDDRMMASMKHDIKAKDER